MVLLVISVMGVVFMYLLFKFIINELKDVDHSSSMDTTDLIALLEEHKKTRKY